MRLSLPHRLLGLITVALAPLVLLSVAATVLLARQGRLEVERTTVLNARAASLAVDAGVSAVASSLDLVLDSDTLEQGDLKAFHAVARRAAEARPQWLALILLDPQGQVVLNSALPYGRHPLQAALPSSFSLALQAERMVVGNLGPGPDGKLGVPVSVPYRNDGRVRYLLAAVVKPDYFADILFEQRPQEGRVLAVIDAGHTIVARTRGQEEASGKPVTPEARAILEAGSQGWRAMVSRDGEKIYAAFNRSALTGWTVSAGVPTEAVEAPVMRAYILVGAGIFASLLVGVFLAMLLSLRITEPLERLRAAALGRGGLHAPQPGTDIPELDEIAQALASRDASRQ